MYIYRCVKRDENNKDDVITGENTHHYEENKLYQHFFKYSKDAEFYFRHSLIPMNSPNYHIGYLIINIDESLLEQYRGYGIYNFGKYSLNPEDKILIPLEEYAIPIEILEHVSEKYFSEKIPEELKNDSLHDNYMEIVMKLYREYNGDSKKIIKEISNMDISDINKVNK